eukprot:gene38334-28017_t
MAATPCSRTQPPAARHLTVGGCTDGGAEGAWAPHVAHCLARIGEGCGLCGYPEKQSLFHAAALDVYHGYAAAAAATAAARAAAKAPPPYCV